MKKYSMKIGSYGAGLIDILRNITQLFRLCSQVTCRNAIYTNGLATPSESESNITPLVPYII